MWGLTVGVDQGLNSAPSVVIGIAAYVVGSVEEAERTRPAAHADPETPTVIQMVGRTRTSISCFPNEVSPLSAQGAARILSWPIESNSTLFDWATCRPDRDADAAEIEQAREVTDQTPVTIAEQGTHDMISFLRSPSPPGRLGISLSYLERIPEHLRVEPRLGDDVNIP